MFLTNLGVDLLRDSSALTNLNKVQTYFKIIEIIGNYHDLYDVCLPEFLMNSSESKIFNSNTIIYRNQLISTRLLRCVYYLSQIKKSTDLTYDKKFIFLDIGGGFGCLSRLILNFFYNSKGILIDLPETNILAASYLTQNFPEKKIKFLSDLNEISILNPSFFNDADFLILPPWAISLIDNNSIDLVINTASLGEMSIDYEEYYLKNINRICKKYFYSHNRKNSKNSIWDGFGHYNFQFEHEWNTILYNSSLGWHLEFLGEKKL